MVINVCLLGTTSKASGPRFVKSRFDYDRHHRLEILMAVVQSFRENNDDYNIIFNQDLEIA